VLALAQQMASALQQPAPVAPPPSQPNAGPTLEDFIARPEFATRQVASAQMAEALAPVHDTMKQFANMQASLVRSNAESRFAEDFKRYGPEIDGLMSQASPEQRTLDNYERVVKYVRGNHQDEIVMEKAKAMLAAGGLGERSGGANGTLTLPGTPGAFDASKLPPGYEDICKRHGITDREVESFCKATGWTKQKWMEEAVNNKVFTNSSPFNWEMRDDQLGIKRQFEA